MSLVLTLKLETGVMIGDDVIVRLVQIKGSQVRIAIDCPKALNVCRVDKSGRVYARHECECNVPMYNSNPANKVCLACKGKIVIGCK